MGCVCVCVCRGGAEGGGEERRRGEEKRGEGRRREEGPSDIITMIVDLPGRKLRTGGNKASVSWRGCDITQT